MANTVQIVFTRSRPLAGCDIDVDGCEFYYSEVYVPVSSDEASVNAILSATEQAKSQLLEAKFDLADISAVIQFNETHWKTDTEMNLDLISNANQAMKSGEVVIGQFRSEEIEEDCEYTFSVNEID